MRCEFVDRALSWLLFALVAVALVGCGSSGAGGSAPVANVPARPAHRPWRTQLAAPAIAACERPVERATRLSASARREIAEPCRSMDERVLENEAIARAVCEELASATSTSPSAAANERAAASCYAGFARTIPPAERVRSSRAP